MATFNFNTAFVKYYNETVPDYNHKLPLRVYNPKSSTTYVRVSITGQGDLLWTFDDDTTQKDLSVNANTTLSTTLVFKPTTPPAETMKDVITLKVEYYKNSDYTGLLGSDTVNVHLNSYIENSDRTWSSSYYPDESVFIWERWPASVFPAPGTYSTGTTITGELGNGRFYLWTKYSYKFEVLGVEGGIVSDSSIRVKARDSGDWTYCDSYLITKTASGTKPPEGFLAGVTKINTIRGYYEEYIYFAVGYTQATTFSRPLDTDYVQNNSVLYRGDGQTGTFKFVVYPYANLYKALLFGGATGKLIMLP